MNQPTNTKLRLAVLCGGPSLERGISLNSARSACDHLDCDDIDVLPLYFDHYKKPYLISRAQLYSNTPSDFDFKLHTAGRALSKTGLKNFLKSVDLVFPIMHGLFGEDGGIQKFLETLKVPYIGSSARACKLCFDKYNSNEVLEKYGFYTVPTLLLKSHVHGKKQLIQEFFEKHNMTRAVVKPARGGSSIGVHSVHGVDEAYAAAHDIFTKRMDTRVVIQPFLEGKEFTVIVMQNRFGQPVALMPSEIEIDYRKNQIFDYRKKYLPTCHVTYHCPPRFEERKIERVQIKAEQLFDIFGMRDFARFDGWILKNGRVLFSDFNPVSGMEQNSFLFQQASQLGFSHRDFLRLVVKNSCKRHLISWDFQKNKPAYKKRKKINVLFGGVTAERQVSVMTGTNAWHKLRRFPRYNARPFLLENEKKVWALPYYLTLNHTAEEIVAACKRAIANKDFLKRIRRRTLIKLAARPGDLNEDVFLPRRMSLSEFIRKSRFVFLGLHGGIGEDGTLQKVLEKQRKFFNGPGSEASNLCMDKFETGQRIAGLECEGIFVAQKKLVDVSALYDLSKFASIKFWKSLKRELSAKSVIVKPHSDGCSAGVVHLYDSTDLRKYVKILATEMSHIPPHTFHKQPNIIEMPTHKLKEVLFEKFIETDEVRVVKNKLSWKKKSGWIEITVGVIGNKKTLHAMNPSLTVSYGEVLSVEEKFQGGTGVNITPPPEKCVKKEVVELAKERITKVAKMLGIEGYSRIDAFLNIYTGEVCIIEANTLPALTPSTVIFHQALAETPKMYPSQLLKELVELGFNRYK